MKHINVGIIGVSGYTGLELVKMLVNHPSFNLNYVANSTGGTTLNELHPSLSSVCELEVVKADVDACSSACELVFLAVPHKTAMAYVAPFMKKGIKIVDFSADYRLTQEVYEEYYCPHTDATNLEEVVYGLPELFREDIKKASIVANPGCFPTSAILGLLPYTEYRTPNTPIIIDAKTGVSGAGKKLSDVTHFVNVNDNMFAYNPFYHRHAPEIAQKLNIDFDEIHFVPHLIPTTRGMISSIYIQVEPSLDAEAVLKEFYKDEPYVRICKNPVDMKNTAGTNFCDIYVKQKGNILFISTSIDNLLRGSSSQALANANLMMGLNENTAIPNIAYVP
ncbi:MAG: N-acetyl-gamma-glutamyl-phosphate reductase [Sulfurimonas sp.]|nr:N-acetyl-gamma-glutamyl-phosphate reductase [Sulfurimonas sp.]MDQ7059939.1 N-acetyl-gamma-glutamyl-phosphate reductase [Sulfurimonas sp.]